jgi:hypothetical protein
MTQEQRDLIHRELSDLKNRKVLHKSSDAQLVHYENLSAWRNSEENKLVNRENKLKTVAIFTMDVVKEMRDKFYYGEPIMIQTLIEMYGNKISHTNIRQLLKNQSYKVDEWNYPDFEERKKQFGIVRDEKYAKDVLTGMGARNFCEKWGVNEIVYSRICKKIGYKAKRYGRNRPPM